MDAAPGSGPPPPEVIVVETRRIACDGVGGALGHPRIFLEMGEGDFIECGYCDRLYALRGGSKDPATPPAQ